MLGWGVSEAFRARFEALATRAGAKLGPPQGTTPLDFWLHCLFRDLLENNSSELAGADKTGGIIRRVCEASATFCARLETKALETSASTDADTWSQINHQLAALKIGDFEPAYRDWFEKKKNALHFRNRNNKNDATVSYVLFRLQIEGMNKWAESVYRIYAEVWAAQGKEKTPDFVRTVFEKAIVPAIEAKAGSSADFLSRRAIITRMSQSILGPHLQELRRAAEKLKADWGRKTEIEALELTYKQQSRAATPQVNGPRPKRYKSSPDVLGRQLIVQKNPGVKSQRLCQLFDEVRISLPNQWENRFNVFTWVEAYKNKKARGLIQKMICTDRNQM